MPGTYNDGSLGALIRQLALRLRALETQQQSSLSNSKRLPFINFGCIPDPSSGARYGVQFLNPTTTHQLAFFGEDTTGDMGLYYYDPTTGTKVSQYDETGLHFYNSSGVETCRIDGNGVHVYDASSNNRVNAGELSNGDYGLQVVDVDGNSEEILPSVFSSASGSFTTTSTTPVYQTGMPEVTVDIGASGKANVWIGGQINAPSSQLAYINVLANGTLTPGGSPGVAWPFTAEGTQYATAVVSGLTPGSTTFKSAISIGGGAAVGTFTAMALTVQPL